MPLQPNEIVQVSYRSEYAGQRILLVTNWKVTSTDSTDPLLVDLNHVITWFKSTAAGRPMTAYIACLGTDVSVKAVRAQVVRPSRSLFMEDTVNIAGTGAGASNTANIAATVTRVSQAAGRKGISTSHLGPIPTANVLDGNLEDAQMTASANFGGEFISDQALTAPNILLTPVILHAPGGPIVSSNIVTFRTGTTARTMRRRTVRVGE